MSWYNPLSWFSEKPAPVASRQAVGREMVREYFPGVSDEMAVRILARAAKEVYQTTGRFSQKDLRNHVRAMAPHDDLEHLMDGV